MSNFADRFKQIRKENDITQAKLADALNVSQNAVFNWETGKREPSLNMLKKISEYFDVSLDYLLRGSVYEQADDISEDKPSSYPGLEKKVSELGYRIIYGTNENADGIDLVSGEVFIQYPDGGKLYIDHGDLSILNDEVDDYLRFRLEELRRKKTE